MFLHWGFLIYYIYICSSLYIRFYVNLPRCFHIGVFKFKKGRFYVHLASKKLIYLGYNKIK